jgi:hypothetical protein
MKLNEITNYFYISPFVDENIKKFILSHQFSDATMACQDEAYRWALLLIKNDIEVEYVFGTCNDEGHAWLLVGEDGEIFDPTAAQFAKINRKLRPQDLEYDNEQYYDKDDILNEKLPLFGY